jgi:hypothetical protein
VRKFTFDDFDTETRSTARSRQRSLSLFSLGREPPVHRGVPILSIVTWLGGIFLIRRGPFTSIEGLPVDNFFTYFACGIICTTIAAIGEFRWARLVSFALSVPAALLGCAGLFGTLLLFFLGSHETQPDTPLYLSVCLAIYLLMIAMPVFWMVLLRKL